MNKSINTNKNNVIIKEILNSTSADNDRKGDLIYNEIIKIIDEGVGEIILDFDGINILNTAFLNNAIGKLYSTPNWKDSNCDISIINFSREGLDLIKEVIVSAREKYRT